MADERLTEAERQWLQTLLISALVAHRSPSGAPIALTDNDRTVLLRLLAKLSGVDKVVTISGPSHDA